MDESQFLQLADKTFRKIQDLLEPVDPDLADYDFSGDVLQVSFANGVTCVINTQRPTRQMWFAAKADAWHFSYEEGSGKWVDDRGSGAELLTCFAGIVKENCGVELAVG